MSKINIIPIFVPHLGCPNDCVFCNQRKITGIRNFDVEEVKPTIEKFIESFKNSENEREIAFYGGSFTAIEEDLQKRLLKIAKGYKEKGLIKRIRISTRPDCISEEILDYLKEYSVDIIELGVQSMDDEVLKKSKRGHESFCVYESSKLIRDYGFILGHQQMVGLPGDTKQKSLETAKKIISIKPDIVRIYPTLVIKNTELEEMYLNGNYESLNLEKAVDIVSDLILMYEDNNINVIRVGLQSTENLQEGKDLVSGPHHDAFRELCESYNFYRILNECKEKLHGDIKIYAPKKIISQISGQRAQNKKIILKEFSLKSLKLIGDDSLIGEIIIENSFEKFKIDISEYKNLLYQKLENKCI